MQPAESRSVSAIAPSRLSPSLAAEGSSFAPLLQFQEFSSSFLIDGTRRVVVEDVCLEVERGGRFALVGESGSGKSVTCLSIIRLLAKGQSTAGKILFEGRNLLHFNEAEMELVRGRRIGFVFQDPLGRMDPLKTVGGHLFAALHRNLGLRGAEARTQAEARLYEVGLTDIAGVMAKYPHQLSGGMSQRVMIALALAGDPDLIIADEPTTALDAATKAHILGLLKRLSEQRRMTLIFVTHDLLSAAALCNRVAVFYAGQVVEIAPVDSGFSALQHPYSLALLRSIPSIDGDSTPRPIPGEMPSLDSRSSACRFLNRCSRARRECAVSLVESRNSGTNMVRCLFPADTESRLLHPSLPRTGILKVANARKLPDGTGEPIVRAMHLCKVYDTRGRFQFFKQVATKAVDNVSISISRGECIALIGESGSGKSTVCRMILGLTEPSSGSLEFNVGHRNDSGNRKPASHRGVQMVFQDARSALDPRMTIAQSLGEPLRVNRIGSHRKRMAAVHRVMEMVHLHSSLLTALPSELSGGQLQRVAIARALVLEPDLLVCDEPTSALDVSVQAQIIKLFMSLKDQLGLAILFVTHDLAVVRPIADRIAVMHKGQLVETGPTELVISRPAQAYTKNLIAFARNPVAREGAGVTSVSGGIATPAGERLAQL